MTRRATLVMTTTALLCLAVGLSTSGSLVSSRSVVVAAATDVAVPDGLGVGGGIGQEGLVEAGLEDRGDRPNPTPGTRALDPQGGPLGQRP
jgi:hypothetical protein